MAKPSIEPTVQKHAQAQRPFQSQAQRITEIKKYLRKQSNGASDSHANVSPSTRKRLNLITFRDLLKHPHLDGSKASKVGAKYVGPNRSATTKPADMVGGTATGSRMHTKKASAVTTKSRVKMTTTAHAYKASRKTKIVKGR